MAIFVYNVASEDHTNNPLNYYIGRGSILGNPWTHIKDRDTKAKYVVGSRDEAIDKYSDYFDVMYSGNVAFKAVIDDMFDHYKKGEDIYLQCFCHPLRCHGDIIAEKLKKRLLKEKINEINKNKNGRIKEMEKVLPSS